MKHLFFQTIGKLSPIIPVPLWMKCTSKNLICPFYHTIAPHSPSMIQHLYTPLSFQRFQNDINFLLKYFTPINAETLWFHISNNKPFDKPSFFLSFDDGLSEVYQLVFPFLKQKGITAAVFVNTDFIDNKDLFYRYKVSLIIEALQQQPQLEKPLTSLLNDFVAYENIILKKRLLSLTSNHVHIINRLLSICDIDIQLFLSNQKPYLTWNEIKELHAEGWYIGSHGTNHTPFQLLSHEQRIMQLKQSFEIIEKHLSQPFRMFAFPFTDVHIEKNFIDSIIHQKLTDIIFGGAGLNNEKKYQHIQRIPMEKYSHLTARQIISSEYFYYLLKSFTGKKYIKR
ncbi:MAG: polysaccharide deacetylase family protein [Bacteroidales bacterium]|nr:polysaccharide deacetylase family protein [Bacteroidales bacterium]